MARIRIMKRAAGGGKPSAAKIRHLMVGGKPSIQKMQQVQQMLPNQRPQRRSIQKKCPCCDTVEKTSVQQRPKKVVCKLPKKKTTPMKKVKAKSPAPCDPPKAKKLRVRTGFTNEGKLKLKFRLPK